MLKRVSMKNFILTCCSVLAVACASAQIRSVKFQTLQPRIYERVDVAIGLKADYENPYFQEQAALDVQAQYMDLKEYLADVADPQYDDHHKVQADFNEPTFPAIA